MKFLVVGLGSIGQRHVRNLRTLLGNKTEITAYRSRGLDLVINEDMSVERHMSPEQRYGVQTFDDMETALDQEPDAVLVTNPTGLHMPTALKAAQYGCNLFIEKPLSDRLDGASDLLEMVERQGLVALVGYQLRFHPMLRKVRQMLSDGAIGRVVSARLEFGEFLPDAHPYEDYRAGYAARRDLGGGVVLSLIHEIDYACWLFGSPTMAFAIGGRLSQLEMDVEDTASILMKCSVEGTMVPVQIHLDFVRRPPTRSLQIVGDQGTIFWDYHSNDLRLFTASSKRWEVFPMEDFQRNQMFLDEMRHFVRCLQGKEKPIVTLRDAIGSLKVALDVKRSMADGNVVEIEPWPGA